MSALWAEMAAEIAARTSAEWEAILDGSDIPNAVLNDLEDLLDVAAHVQERWAVSYGLSALSRLPHRMGLSWQTTRPAHPKGATGFA